MNKKRVLFVSEASYLSTGYATYSREVLKRLHASGKYELAEFSIYGHHEDERRKDVPWKTYPNMPAPGEKDLLDKYRQSPVYQFGAWRFERMCLDFNPTHVMSIRDFWMDSFISASPYRQYFKWVWMPTIDGDPQALEWVSLFSECDALLTYSDWAIDVLKRQGGDYVKIHGSAPASAQPEFQILNKKYCRESLGLSPDSKIVGTVMRNQRRKLFPDLMDAFKGYLEKTGDDNTYLYLHTSYPDAGWDLAQLTVEKGLGSRVLMTYHCEKCENTFVSFFSGAVRPCTGCGEFSAKSSSVNNGVDVAKLSEIYNCMDLYVQLANSEGLGLPWIEASACGVPIMATNYSAMESEVPKVGGTLLPLYTKHKEMETGCMRAAPNIEYLTDKMVEFFSKPEAMRRSDGFKTRKGFEKSFSWETTTQKWMDVIDGLDPVPHNLSWGSPCKASAPIPPENIPENPNNKNFLDWMFTHYLKSPEKIGTHAFNCLLRDFNNGMFKPNPGGHYYSESSVFGRTEYQPMSKDTVLKIVHGKLMEKNFWEDARVGKIKLDKENWL